MSYAMQSLARLLRILYVQWHGMFFFIYIHSTCHSILADRLVLCPRQLTEERGKSLYSYRMF